MQLNKTISLIAVGINSAIESIADVTPNKRAASILSLAKAVDILTYASKELGLTAPVVEKTDLIFHNEIDQTTPTTESKPEPTPEKETTSAPKKRKRRSKAEIEAEKAAVDKSPKKYIPASEQKAKEEPQESAPEATITLDEVRKLIVKVVEEKGPQAAKAIVATSGHDKLGKVPSEKYQELADTARKALGE